MSELVEKIAKDIRDATELLKSETSKYKYGDINLDRGYIITHTFNIKHYPTVMMGMPVLFCDLQSSFDYFIALDDPNDVEIKWLKCHREIMEESR